MFTPRSDDHLERFEDTPVQIVGQEQFNQIVANANAVHSFGKTKYYYDLRNNILARLDDLIDGCRYVIYPQRS